jgi:tRNA dimethylallyltransferase
LKQLSNKRVIIIAGPTAVGKTAVAIDIAKHFQTSVISADSRQCFKELNIGVARPSEKELAEVQHHFIASHSIHDEVTAVVFEQYALEKTRELFTTHDTIVMVGGTGLYIKAFCEGLDEIPAVDAAIREKINKTYEEKGLSWLQHEMKMKDPAFYKEGESCTGFLYYKDRVGIAKRGITSTHTCQGRSND